MVYTLRYKRGDTTPLFYAIEDWDQSAQTSIVHDLTNQSVLFSIAKDGNETWDLEDQPCSIVSASEGTVEIAWPSSITSSSGMYRCLFTVIDGEGNRMSYPEYGIQWIWIYDDLTM